MGEFADEAAEREMFAEVFGLDKSPSHKVCEYCGATVQWQQTANGWRLYEMNEDDEDKVHVCRERILAETKATGVIIGIQVPTFKKK